MTENNVVTNPVRVVTSCYGLLRILGTDFSNFVSVTEFSLWFGMYWKWYECGEQLWERRRQAPRPICKLVMGISDCYGCGTDFGQSRVWSACRAYRTCGWSLGQTVQGSSASWLAPQIQYMNFFNSTFLSRFRTSPNFGTETEKSVVISDFSEKT